MASNTDHLCIGDACEDPKHVARTPLAVIVQISGEDSKQFTHWKDAVAYVDQFAQGDDPVMVSMFTIYWGDDSG